MKKLFVLMLVLVLASAANATLTLTSSLGTTLDVGDTTMIGIYNDSAVPNAAGDTWVIVTDTTDGEWTGRGGTIYYPPAISHTSVYTYYYDDGATWHAQLGQPSMTEYGIGTLADFEFECTGAGDVTITLYADDMETEIDSIVITQIPEPMTVALLGLGGLFLRRRK